MASEFKQVIAVPNPNGEGMLYFENMTEAKDFLRKPKVMEAMLKVTQNDQSLADWLYERQDFLEDTFAVGTITRVTKSERNQLSKALDYVKALYEEDKQKNKALAFIADNAGAVLEVFRWPTVKRMTDEEKAVLINNSLMAAAENREDLVAWIIANKEAIFEAFEAGKEKRPVSDKAKNALEAYRLKMKEEKEKKDAAAAAEQKAE